MRTAVATSLLVLLTVSGCSSPRRGEPIVGGAPPLDAQIVRGERVFMAHCHQCHPGGEGGLAPAINDKPLPGFLIKFQVRQGIGAMPAFSSEEIRPEELNDLVAYLKALRG
jgi:mono/diheme cytochrome c family protein